MFYSHFQSQMLGRGLLAISIPKVIAAPTCGKAGDCDPSLKVRLWRVKVADADIPLHNSLSFHSRLQVINSYNLDAG